MSHIIENDLIRSELEQALSENTKAKINWFLGDRLDSILQSEKSCSITLASGQQIVSQLLIGADGASSITRRKLGLASMTRSYEQSGLVAQLKLEKPHQQTAYQRFIDNDILAFLPLTSENEVSMVWSVTQGKADQVIAQEKKDVEQQLIDIMQNEFGQVEILTDVKSFPLQVPSSARR